VDVMLRSSLSILLVCCLLGAAGCLQIEPDPPLDDEGEPIALPEANDRWLRVVELAPSPTIGVRPHLAFRFNDYIDPTSFRSYAFGAMHSGGLRNTGAADYVMTDKTVYWRPWSALEPGLLYTFRPIDEIISATGSPLLPPVEWPIFEVDDGGDSVTPTSLPEATWADVEAIVEAYCTDCHRDPSWGLNPLTYDSLVGARSAQTDLFLVRRGDPAGSYLMRKVLWDYPDIEFTPQPPPWSAGAEELSREELLLIEGWIANGAKP
jgi:hypothetical protein